MKKITIAMVAMTVAILTGGCEKAEEILLEEGESETVEIQEEVEATQEAQREEAQETIIQVECDCQCTGGSSASEDVTEDGKVNINTADSAKLQTLNGIGETRAQAIVDYRKENGPFQSIEEIKNVSGIKDATYNKIKDEISVE